MSGTVIAVSGAIGTRRSAISQALAERLSWKCVKFSTHLKNIITDDGGDPEDRVLLQKVGQNLVQSDPRRFVASVLKDAGWQSGDNLVIDGLRHAEVRLALVGAIEPSHLYYVHIEVDEITRQKTADKVRGIQERVLYRYDQDLTEAQLPKILPAYADQIVDGSLPLSMVTEKIASRLPSFS